MILHGDCLIKLKDLQDNSIDSIVTDPPYGLSFMSKTWDYDVPTEEIWRECLRVLKPGGHLVSFFGTRTYHRGVVRIEDAGFEIRDQIQWIYGSGFPKSTDVSKRIDKEAGAERTEIVGKKYCGLHHRGGVNSFTDDNWKAENREGDFTNITAPATESAKQWQGWGTALKPANEPIVVARKPLEKDLTVAQNVIKWGTGAINIDSCRIATKENLGSKLLHTQSWKNTSIAGVDSVNDNWKFGRWPANILFDEQAAEMLGEPSRFFYIAKASKSERNEGLEGMPLKKSGIKNDSGREFSESDPHKIILNQNYHPTVKPIKLMQYLIKLVTPPKGTTLDPFMGSGSTGVAAKKLGFDFVGIEMNEEYFQIAKKRIENVDKIKLEFE